MFKQITKMLEKRFPIVKTFTGKTLYIFVLENEQMQIVPVGTAKAKVSIISNLKPYLVHYATNGELTPFLITNPSRIESFGPTRVTKHEYGQYIAYVWAVDEKHAAKIASDKIAEFKYCEEDEK